jgi:hypothetical protein
MASKGDDRVAVRPSDDTAIPGAQSAPVKKRTGFVCKEKDNTGDTVRDGCRLSARFHTHAVPTTMAQRRLLAPHSSTPLLCSRGQTRTPAAGHRLLWWPGLQKHREEMLITQSPCNNVNNCARLPWKSRRVAGSSTRASKAVTVLRARPAGAAKIGVRLEVPGFHYAGTNARPLLCSGMSPRLCQFGDSFLSSQWSPR